MDDRFTAIRAKAAERGLAFGPPLPEEDVAKFEALHNVELPQSFRRFLTSVGNGGAGPPAYGLMRLGEVPDDLPDDWAEEWRTLRNVRRLFPLTEGWIWEDEDFEDERLAAVRHGTLNMGTDGCGLYWLLVVTGAERGQVWAHTDVGVCPQAPGLGFVEWIEAWLGE